MTASPRIVAVRTAAALLVTIALFRAYLASLDVNLGYQYFEGEMAAKMRPYASGQAFPHVQSTQWLKWWARQGLNL